MQNPFSEQVWWGTTVAQCIIIHYIRVGTLPKGKESTVRRKKGCNWSGCNLRPRLLPTAFTAYCPLFEPMSADRPHSQCLECSLPALSLVISPFTVRSGPLDSWTLLG